MRSALEPDHDLLGEDEPPRDLILGAPALLGIFVAVSLICAVCFGFGYSSGHTLHTVAPHVPVPLNGSSSGTDTASAAPPDNDAYAKPTPDAVTPGDTAPDADNGAQAAAQTETAAAGAETHVPVSAAPSTVATRKPSAGYAPLPANAPGASTAASRGAAAYTTPQTAAQGAPPSPYREALPVGQQAAQTAATPAAAQPAAPAAAGAPVMVQIAAVTKASDAESLAQALRHDGFSASVRTSLTDSFFHVQVGPFTDMNAARTMRARLANDGYNAFIKH